MSTEKRPRVGLIVPSTQVVTEPLFNRVMGAKWDFVAARALLRGSGVKELKEMDRHVPRAADELATAHVDVIVSCCTASGAINGRERDERVRDEIAIAAGVAATSTMLSIVDNLRDLRARNLIVVTPYLPELARVEHRYFSDNGFAVVGGHDGGVADPWAMSEAPMDAIVQAALSAWTDRADALLLSCMNWPTHEAAQILRAKLGAPVVTSHSATLWGVGQLLDGTRG